MKLSESRNELFVKKNGLREASIRASEDDVRGVHADAQTCERSSCKMVAHERCVNKTQTSCVSVHCTSPVCREHCFDKSACTQCTHKAKNNEGRVYSETRCASRARVRGEDREGEAYGNEGDSCVAYTGCFTVKDDSNYRTCNKRDAGETSFKSQQNLASHEAKLHTLRSFAPRAFG